MYQIFKQSMNSKILTMGLVSLILIPISAYYYEIVILDFENKHYYLVELKVIKEAILYSKSDDYKEIQKLVQKTDEITESIMPTVLRFYNSLLIIKFLCYVNLTYLIQHVVTFSFT